VKIDNKKLSREKLARPVFHFEIQPEVPEFEETGCVEWNSSIKALAEFLAALGVADPGTTARSIIEEFGTLSDLLSGSWWRLRRVVGSRLARAIQSSHGLMKAMFEEAIEEGPIVPRSNALIGLLQAEVGFLKHERLLALYVDSECRLMRIERIADGAFDQVSVDNRSIIGCALAIGAAAFILVHNHPSGIPQPSTADVAFTDRLKSLAADLNLVLLDHLIIARGRVGTVYEYWQEAQWSQQPDALTPGSAAPAGI
jgi:DNA repair protein RadC